MNSIAAACDCHMHIFGEAARFQILASAGYVPPLATPEAYREVADRIEFRRTVLVQPSVYGTDHRCLLQALDLMPGETRAVAVLDPDADVRMIRHLHELGFRGVRFNIVHSGAANADAIRRLAARIAEFGWHLEFFAPTDMLSDLLALHAAVPCDLVFDHFGNVRPADGVDGSDFVALLKGLESGKIWVKLSAPYRLGGLQPPYSQMSALAARLARTRSDRLVWGTDWPHAMVPSHQPHAKALLDALTEWLSPQALDLALRNNPEKLYDFPTAGSA